MMMTRQILMCTASVAAALALSACGKNNESAPEVPATSPPAATAAAPATPPATTATAQTPASSGTAMAPMHSGSAAPPPASTTGH